MPDNLKKRRDKFKTAAKQTTAPAEKGAKKPLLGGGSVSRQAKTQFSVQFATLQDAGLPVLRSLKILEGQMPPGKFKDVLREVSEDVEGGTPLSEALGKHPKVFDGLYTNIVRAGEAGEADEADGTARPETGLVFESAAHLLEAAKERGQRLDEFMLDYESAWRPAEEIIQRSLDRTMQGRLVGEMVVVCQANSIDPEDLDGLASHLDGEGEGVVSQFHGSLVEFFKSQLKMQE